FRFMDQVVTDLISPLKISRASLINGSFLKESSESLGLDLPGSVSARISSGGEGDGNPSTRLSFTVQSVPVISFRRASRKLRLAGRESDSMMVFWSGANPSRTLRPSMPQSRADSIQVLINGRRV